MGSGLQSGGRGAVPALAVPFERRRTEILWVGCGGRGPAAAPTLRKADAGRGGVDSGVSLSSTSKRLPFLPISSLLFKGL